MGFSLVLIARLQQVWMGEGQVFHHKWRTHLSSVSCRNAGVVNEQVLHGLPHGCVQLWQGWRLWVLVHCCCELCRRVRHAEPGKSLEKQPLLSWVMMTTEKKLTLETREPVSNAMSILQRSCVRVGELTNRAVIVATHISVTTTTQLSNAATCLAPKDVSVPTAWSSKSPPLYTWRYIKNILLKLLYILSSFHGQCEPVEELPCVYMGVFIYPGQQAVINCRNWSVTKKHPSRYLEAFFKHCSSSK